MKSICKCILLIIFIFTLCGRTTSIEPVSSTTVVPINESTVDVEILPDKEVDLSLAEDNDPQNAFLGLYMTGLSEGYLNIQDLPPEYPNEQAQKDGCFVIGAMVHNENKYVEFMNHCENNEPAFIRVYQNTVEGDPIIFDIFYSTGSNPDSDAGYKPKISIVRDDSRDKFAAPENRNITYAEYEGVAEYEIEGKTCWVAYRGNKENISLDSENTFVIAYIN